MSNQQLEPLKVVFMGSDELACPALARLLASPFCRVQAVLTQPDRPSGRKLKTTACPAKLLASEQGCEVLTPDRVGSPEVADRLQALAPDVIVVAAYGQYIPASLLDLPRLGMINIHPSLLPKYRGASPIQWALADGLEETGVTILYVGEEMDAGDMILQEAVPIKAEDTAVTLKPRLAEFGAELLLRAMEALARGDAPRIPQDPGQASYVKKLTKEDGRMDWSLPAASIRNRIRGFAPWPACTCICPGNGDRRLKVLKARVEPGDGPPGAVLQIGEDGPLVACGDQALRLLEVQPEGKRAMSAPAFLRGHALAEGDRFR